MNAGEVASVTFETKFSTGGDHKVEVRLADDRLSADNRRYYSLEIVQEAQVLLVDGKDKNDPLLNETGYLQFVLSPKDPENPDKQNVITTEPVPQQRFAEKNLLNDQAIVLSNVTRVPRQLVSRLEKQVRAGMGLVIFLGDQVDVDDYNNAFGDAGVKLLPAKIKSSRGAKRRKSAIQQLPPIGDLLDRKSFRTRSCRDFKNPEYAKLLNEVKVYRAFDLEVPANDDSVRVVAYLANGKPAIVERKVGSGLVVFLYVFPATTAWSNLPTKFAFPILMQRCLSNMLTLGNRFAQESARLFADQRRDSAGRSDGNGKSHAAAARHAPRHAPGTDARRPCALYLRRDRPRRLLRRGSRPRSQSDDDVCLERKHRSRVQSPGRASRPNRSNRIILISISASSPNPKTS